MSKIEVESRALLSSAERATMLDHMRTLGAIRKIHRVSIDFSGDCVGKGLAYGEVRIQQGDKKTCIVTASYIEFD